MLLLGLLEGYLEVGALVALALGKRLLLQERRQLVPPFSPTFRRRERRHLGSPHPPTRGLVTEKHHKHGFLLCHLLCPLLFFLLLFFFFFAATATTAASAAVVGLDLLLFQRNHSYSVHPHHSSPVRLIRLLLGGGGGGGAHWLEVEVLLPRRPEPGRPPRRVKREFRPHHLDSAWRRSRCTRRRRGRRFSRRQLSLWRCCLCRCHPFRLFWAFWHPFLRASVGVAAVVAAAAAAAVRSAAVGVFGFAGARAEAPSAVKSIMLTPAHLAQSNRG
mmetsp:Transcript_53681/g.100056  ORF Transcript_53681/g.100056 Transcript_53681/m.100056 type:complete len:274 (-) Transcript_53681:444-1265(-)